MGIGLHLTSFASISTQHIDINSYINFEQCYIVEFIIWTDEWDMSIVKCSNKLEFIFHALDVAKLLRNCCKLFLGKRFGHLQTMMLVSIIPCNNVWNIGMETDEIKFHRTYLSNCAFFSHAEMCTFWNDCFSCQ